VPEFAHIPLIHGPDGAKLSKRHGALGVDAYRAMGYLPQAMRNYLVRLGWSHGDDEIMSTEQMIEWFGLDAIGRAPARFDFDRLDSLNGHYMREAADEALLERLLALWARSEEYAALLAALTPQRKAQLSLAISSLKGRSKTLVELTEGARFLFAERPLGLDDKAAALIDEEARDTLRLLLADLEALGTWSGPALEEAVRSFVERHGLKLGAVAQPLRAALTGTTRSPGIFEVLEILGRSEATARISDQVSAPA
jgi:glutamyl-tRNA synthetase